MILRVEKTCFIDGVYYTAGEQVEATGSTATRLKKTNHFSVLHGDAKPKEAGKKEVSETSGKGTKQGTVG